MLQAENEILEYKREMTNTFLKTVSAYANFQDGTIIFGVDDDRNVIGVNDPISFATNLTNKINDRISPIPDYEIEVEEQEKLVILHIRKGMETPYLYQGKAYRRRNSSTIEVDRQVLEDLILAGRNLTFDELPASQTQFSFQELEKECQKKLKIERLGSDTLKSLGLLTQKGYNRAAELLSDTNHYPGIDIVLFGEDENTIHIRKTIEKCSLLTQYSSAIQFFEDHYIIERIIGFEREEFQRIPSTAFREALANALIHRSWSGRGQILIKMRSDQISIISSGGLPEGVSEQDYLEDTISVPRNPILAYVFLRLGYIERLGTGISRIQNAYAIHVVKPDFHISENSITVVLPAIDHVPALTLSEKELLDQLPKNILLSRKDIESITGFGRGKLTTLLNHLCDKRWIDTVGKGRATKYIRR